MQRYNYYYSSNTYIKPKSEEDVDLPVTFFVKMRRKGIQIEEGDYWVVSEIETYLISNKYMTIKEMNEWNDNAVEYLGNHKPKTSKDFINLFYRSRSMKRFKGTVPFKEIIDKATKDCYEFKKWFDEAYEKLRKEK